MIRKHMENKMNSFYVIVFIKILWKIYGVGCTIDINISELEYLASHLDPYECHRLIAALHYTTYELPQSISGAERKVDKEIPCLRQLLHWNSSPEEGRGRTHQDVEHRLRQINRKDLADWLGKTVFKKLGKDIEKSLNRPFGELGDQKSETQYPITLDPLDEPDEEDTWGKIDGVLMLLLATLLICLGLLIVLLLFRKIIVHLIKRRNQNVKQTKSKSARKIYDDEGSLLSSESD